MRIQGHQLPIVLACLTAATNVHASDFAGPNQFICGTATTLEADPLGSGETGFWSVVQGNTTFGNSSSPTSFVSDLEFGENVLMWTKITPNGASPDNVSIWCYNNAMPLANAGPDQVVTAPPGMAFMNASAPIPPAICFWTFVQGSGVIANPNDPNTMVTGITIGTNVLMWNCDNGPCGSSADDIIVEGTEVVGIEEAFTHGKLICDICAIRGRNYRGVNTIRFTSSRGLPKLSSKPRS